MYIQNKWCTKQLLTTCQQFSRQPLSSGCSPSQLPTIFLHDIIWYRASFHELRSAGLLLSPPSSLYPPPTKTPCWQDSMRSWETEMPFALYSTAQQQLKRCVINIVSLLKPKHSIIPDTMKEKSALSQLKPGHSITDVRNFCDESFIHWIFNI